MHAVFCNMLLWDTTKYKVQESSNRVSFLSALKIIVFFLTFVIAYDYMH